MDRRSFLIGAGSILTSAYVAKANWFLTNKNSVVPLLKSNKDTTKLFFSIRARNMNCVWEVQIWALKILHTDRF